MKRYILAILAVAVLIAAAASARNNNNASPAPKQPQTMQADIDVMRGQEYRVMVLQQVTNEEMAKLYAMQEGFCGRWKLDLEKFRKGGYRYDDKTGKVVEAGK